MDLKDAFYHFELPTELRQFFTLRPVTAGSVGVTSLGGQPVRPTARIFPRMRVVPMGWSWALWWCQSILERCADAAGAEPSEKLYDGSPPAPLVGGVNVRYVDKCVAMGTDAAAARRLALRVGDELRRRGLVVTEVAREPRRQRFRGPRLELRS